MVKVTFIGSGNVATHLANSYFSKGVSVSQVYSRKLDHAKELAEGVDANPIDNLKLLNLTDITLLIVAVKDDEIKSISQRIESAGVPVVHTSGTISIDSVSNHESHGVFYPLQTFSKEKEMDLSSVPFCIEANSKSVRNLLIDMASIISNDVRNIDSETRKSLHLAAVFACNFSNHMLTIADELLEDVGQDVSILNPLVKETINKALNSNPEKVQTGPAIRNDRKVIENHVNRLSTKPNLQRIYKDITESIINWKNE